MPEDLDDFEIEPTRRANEDGAVPPYRPDPPERRGASLGFPAILAVLALVAVGLLGVLYLLFRHPATPEVTPLPLTAATPAPRAPEATPSPQVVLPPLDESDAFVRQVAAALSAHPELTRWLARTGLVRTLTAVVANVAEGATPRIHLEFLAPKQGFRARRGGGRRTVPDPAGFAAYDAFGDAVGSVDAAAAAAAYHALAPLFEAAYVELGHPEGGFPAVLDRAIAALLAAPVPPDDAELVAHATGFRYADPRLESLTAAQKQLLRTGARNVRLVQGKLRELQATLHEPSSKAHEPPARAVEQSPRADERH